MSTQQSTIDYLLGQIDGAGAIQAKKMFGEYGVYCDGKMIALVCDDQLFLKPTEAGRNYLQEVEEGLPYPGAKPWFYISEDKWDDVLWLTELIRVTVPEVPAPKPKKPKRQSP